MPNLLSTIASAFDAEPTASTISDVGLVANRLAAPLMSFGQMGKQAASLKGASSGPQMAMKPGMLYVHAKRPDEPVPAFAPLPRTGVPDVDATFDLRGAQLQHEMAREFSEFSLAGLAWAEACSREDAQLAAVRAKEDAALAQKRMEEDAAIAARRAQQDSERMQHSGTSAGAFRTKREEEELALQQRWKTRFAELSAALEEALAAHEQRQALEEQRLKEEHARAQEKAAREAALAAERASRQTELAEDARRLAELATLRLATSPTVRSLILVSAEQVAPALAYACPIAGTPLRRADRSWWKALHLLEAEGLTPSLKGTEVGEALFAAFDDDSDGAVPCPDAGFLLGLLMSGTTKDRVDAACDAPGAPANGATVTAAAALRQLQVCARARKHCAPKMTALLTQVSAADATTMVPVPMPDVLERSVGVLFGGAPSLPGEKFRSWAANTPAILPLFAPLGR